MDFFRVEIDMRMYEPERGHFDWDNEEMQALYRILDHCQANQADVLLAQMWQDVAWNAHEGVCRLQSAPKSVDDFAAGLGTLLERLVKTKKYTCIRWLTVGNEPGFDACWWLGPDKKPASIMPAIRAVPPSWTGAVFVSWRSPARMPTNPTRPASILATRRSEPTPLRDGREPCL